MTTILESPPQVTVIPEQVQKQTVPTPTPTPAPKKRRFTAAIVVGVVALVAALTALALGLANTTTTTAPAQSAPAANTALFTAYGPGTTVYAEQVPALAPAVSYYEGPVGHGTTFEPQALSPGTVQLAPDYAYTDLVQVPKTVQLAPDYAYTDLVQVPKTTQLAPDYGYTDLVQVPTPPATVVVPHGAAPIE